MFIKSILLTVVIANAVNVFAFLEFATEEEARRALSAEVSPIVPS